MQDWRRRLSDVAPILTFDYPYQLRGSSRPDPLATLIEAHRAELTRGRATQRGRPILIGKSMGGRVGCHLADSEPCAGVVCFGYPLRSQTGKLRDQALLAMTVPALFLQGTRDPLCDVEELRGVLSRRSARSDLHIVESGDHSLVPTRAQLKATNATDEDVRNGILERIRSFVESL